MKRYLGILNISELSKNGRLKVLKEFIIASFQAHFDGKNILAIKALDSMIKKVFTNYEIHSEQIICMVTYFRNLFNDYRNKYN